MARGFRYSKWDGTQTGFDLDADALLSEMSDDLIYHNDVNAALRRMLQQGLRDRNGEELMGLREMLQRLKERRRQEIVEDLATERRRQLDEMPPDLASRVQALQEYDFMDDGARHQFEELMNELREQLMQSYFNQLSEGMQNLTPERMQRMKDMLAELNQMLEQRERGEEPDFDGFMERHGDFFPGNPQNLDELLEQMAQSMAQMQQLLNSMTPEQRAQLQALAESLMEDIDLNWQVQQLAGNLQRAFPDMPWQRSMSFDGDNPLSMGQMPGLLDTLGDLDDLENLLRSATQPGQLAEVDLDRARELLGDEAAQSLDKMSELARKLQEAGLIENKEGRFELTPRGIRRIGQNALSDLFKKLDSDKVGKHEVERSGTGHEREYDTKPYEFGDPFNLHIERTVRNAVRRSGGGTPVRLLPEDFEVERTEHIVRSSTVLMLDLSLSMPMRDNFLPAKKVTMALHSLISSQYPRDYLGIVGFSETARELKPEQLPEVSWDFVYGTNMQHAFQISRRLLSRQIGTKQIIMITDGEPTAHITERGDVFFNYPPVRETVDATLREVNRCTRDGIRINTFMLDPTQHLRQFIEKLTELNRGRAFFTTPETLGDYVLVDFIEQKRKLLRGRRTA
ncbi:MAG: hypothetical protein ACXV8G_09255 [Acidimicrobiales bacterium]